MGKTFKDNSYKLSAVRKGLRNSQLEATKEDNSGRFNTKIVPDKHKTEKSFNWRKELDF